MGYVSASSSTTMLYENVQHRRMGRDNIQYYEYKSVKEKNITVLLTPMNNCKPILLFLD